MATVTLKGNTIHTLGALPEVGTLAPVFKLAKVNLSDVIVIGRVENVDEGKAVSNTKIALVKVINIIKGQLEDTHFTITFGDESNHLSTKDETILIPGKKYAMFLVKENVHYYILGGVQGYFHVENDIIVYGNERIDKNDFIKKINAVPIVAPSEIRKRWERTGK